MPAGRWRKPTAHRRLFAASSGHFCLRTSKRARVHFCPQHLLLCNLGLYYFEFEAPSARTPKVNT